MIPVYALRAAANPLHHDLGREFVEIYKQPLVRVFASLEAR
jgi:hypothetical protein